MSSLRSLLSDRFAHILFRLAFVYGLVNSILGHLVPVHYRCLRWSQLVVCGTCEIVQTKLSIRQSCNPR